MAANSGSFIRVRLFFDYPPPSVVDCRMCWLLVDLNTCRVVSDLESLIRDKFGFSSRSIFNLFIDDCYLPHTESIFLVRDNDSVWVKVDSAAQVNGHSSHPDTSSKNCRKLNRPTEEEEEEEDEAEVDERSVEWKKKKKKKKRNECLNGETDQVSRSKKCKTKSKDKHAKKEKKKKQKAEKNDSTVTSKSTAATIKKPTGAEGKTQSKKSTVSSKSSSDSSEEDEAPAKKVVSKSTPKTPLSTIKTTTGNDTKQKTTPGKKSVVPSVSSSSSSEEDEAPRTKTASKPDSKRQSSTPATVNAPTGDKSTQKKTQSKKSSDSSSGEDGEAPKKSLTSKLVSKPSLPGPAASKTSTGGKPAQSKAQPASSSSSETSSDEATSVRAPPRGKPFTSLSPPRKSQDDLKTRSTSCTQERPSNEATPPLGDGVAATRNSDSEEEIELIIRKPSQQLLKGVGGQSSWRGGNNRRAAGGGRGSRGDRGRGGGRGDVRGRGGRFGSSCNGAVEPSYQTDLLTNESVVIQNGAEVEAAPKKDYSIMPLLAAPPQVGQRIAFKLLELTENYTPEVSEYKEGKIVRFDPVTKQMELEIFNETHAPVEPGKFDLVYQNADGSERVEYAVSRGAWVRISNVASTLATTNTFLYQGMLKT
ncbi:coilin [Cynoglossus semilaevis]|uniref:Coilin p80 n=1 Tax=Cynoglossus semilaevis TaxID=244447 RepID=A0A3P8W883_CYNSE|nr:coilin [Cynoglossus semilaevis]